MFSSVVPNHVLVEYSVGNKITTVVLSRLFSFQIEVEFDICIDKKLFFLHDVEEFPIFDGEEFTPQTVEIRVFGTSQEPEIGQGYEVRNSVHTWCDVYPMWNVQSLDKQKIDNFQILHNHAVGQSRDGLCLNQLGELIGVCNQLANFEKNSVVLHHFVDFC